MAGTERRRPCMRPVCPSLDPLGRSGQREWWQESSGSIISVTRVGSVSVAMVCCRPRAALGGQRRKSDIADVTEE